MVNDNIGEASRNVNGLMLAQVKGVMYLLVTWNGETKSLGDWASYFGVARHVLYKRIVLLKWSVEKAFSTEKAIFAKHGKTNTPEWNSWVSMIKRCTDENNKQYSDYGGRGIKVCERWFKFVDFFADMGKKTSSAHSLDRIDVNGDYEPCNCRWATKTQQNRNQRRIEPIVFNGQAKLMTDWAKELGIPLNVISHRLRYGWSVHRTLTQPVRKTNR